MRNTLITFSLALAMIIGGCSQEISTEQIQDDPIQAVDKEKVKEVDKPNEQSKSVVKEDVGRNSGQAQNGESEPAVKSPVVVAEPESLTALVNKHHQLPNTYKPADLVYPNVSFTFSDRIEKCMLRQPAAEALEEMFQEAKKNGIYLLGVSAYRSHERQKALFAYYSKRDGEEKALTYSALPGTSEHETGLAIDVTGGDGTCAVSDCFGGTKEANWLKAHAAEYGFIVRYPEGKEYITGYKYEPWHLRYVGKQAASVISSDYETLEVYSNQVNAF
ncbi:M15 family metallopeptidase [Bacillus sp. 1780r2a1]|uniref:M15 family metallopeptidase n=1 Tax=Priestia flexa TaxID=86664 RepID=UPI00220F66BC|nr:M15 family metallopeptidase [Bacillus sp. 1780r2a1]